MKDRRDASKLCLIKGTDDVQSFVRRYVKAMRDRGQQADFQRDGIAKESAAGYERPYNAQELKKLYSAGLAARLLRDPVHSWRAKTGIELLHREPTKEELVRIIRNWKRMSDRQKRLSDEKSVELFGKGNMDRVDELLSLYEKKAAAKPAGLGILGRVVGWLRAGKAARTAAVAEPVRSLAALRGALKSEIAARRGMQRLTALLPDMEAIRASGLRGDAFQAAMREFGASKVDPVMASTRDAIIRRLREITKRHSFADDRQGTWARVQRFGIRTAKDNPRGVLEDVSAALKSPDGRTADDTLAAAFESGWKYRGEPAFNPAVDNGLLAWLPPVKRASAGMPDIYAGVRMAYGDLSGDAR